MESHPISLYILMKLSYIRYQLTERSNTYPRNYRFGYVISSVYRANVVTFSEASVSGIHLNDEITSAQVKIANLILDSKFVIFCQEYFSVLEHSASKR